ncbi:hypothetical protein D1007_52107 [Hordeum vulgare]|nr:hypothetical protein D1007_52107 [Hordeum vulgare]
MAPAGKQKRETQGPAPAPPIFECALSKDVDLTPVLPWTAAESTEHGRTLIWSGATAKPPASKAAEPILERFSRDNSAKRLTGGMIVKEFLAQRAMSLHAHSRPLWDYQSGDDKPKLRSQELRIEELNRVMATLLGGDPGDLPEAMGPMYRLNDRVDLIATLPVFDERGLFSAEGSGPVEVSSDDTFGGDDSEKTVDDYRASTPLPSWVVLLC